jgi:hypothetical protein
LNAIDKHSLPSYAVQVAREVIASFFEQPARPVPQLTLK